MLVRLKDWTIVTKLYTSPPSKETNNMITCPFCGDTYPDYDVAHVCSRGPYAPQLKAQLKAQYKHTMNERIKELAKQAEQTFGGTFTFNGGEVSMINLEKFAELIIAECASLVVGDPAFILEHFGVEE